MIGDYNNTEQKFSAAQCLLRAYGYAPAGEEPIAIIGDERFYSLYPLNMFVAKTPGNMAAGG